MLWFLEQLVKTDLDQEVGLVINGDFVDFLAEAPAVPFDPCGAIQKLERIALQDATFSPIFAALVQVTATPRRKLIVNLGNHDIELAVPWVRDRLTQLLAETPEARTRLHFVFDGSGVRATVGTRSVLCVHGNEVDRWNPVDYEKLREISRDIHFGRAQEEWVPNAGTRLVVTVMNKVKRKFPFVDLLKPEKESVLPMLAACDPGQLANLEHLRNLAAVGGQRLVAAARKPRGMLGVDDEPGSEPTPAFQSPLPSRSDAAQRATEIMRAIELEVQQGTEPLDLVRAHREQQLDWFGAGVNWFRGRSPSEILSEALEALDKDRSFEANEPDDTSKALDREISPEIDFVVAGHTHLERALRRRNGCGYYFNSGTWARLIRIDPAVRRDPDRFERLFEQLRDATMSQLDEQPGLVLKRCTVVVIERQSNGSTTGQLRNVGDTGQGIAWKIVEGTTFERAD
jgi:hypothetical protein